MGFPIRSIQIDNGAAFVNDQDRIRRESAFGKALQALDIQLCRMRPYSPWKTRKSNAITEKTGKCFTTVRSSPAKKDCGETSPSTNDGTTKSEKGSQLQDSQRNGS